MTNGHADAHGPVPPDPGWTVEGRDLLAFLVPPLLVRRSEQSPRQGDRPPIHEVRSMFLVLVGVLVTILIVLAFVLPLSGDDEATVVDYAVVAVAVISPWPGPWFRLRLIGGDGGGDGELDELDELARRYRAGFFLAAAHSMTAAALGFVVSLYAQELWPYLIGMVAAAVGLAASAPTEADLVKFEQRFLAAGFSASLRRAVYTTAGTSEG